MTTTPTATPPAGQAAGVVERLAEALRDSLDPDGHYSAPSLEPWLTAARAAFIEAKKGIPA